MAEAPRVGAVTWQDLTVPNAEPIRDFYAAVVGWRAEPVEMGGYSDFNMVAPDGRPAAGICHARGANARLPPQWLLYVTVENLDASLEACLGRGGVVVDGPRGMGEQRFAVIRDPAGAHMGLIGPKT